MKVIFIKDLKKHGKKDEIKDFNDGFAKYLVNEGYAVYYSKVSKNVLDKEIKNRSDEENKLILECEKIKKQLENTSISFKVKTGSYDKIFGKISSKQISDELLSKGFNIDKKKILLDSDINTLGSHIITINLHKSVKAKLRIDLIK